MPNFAEPVSFTFIAATIAVIFVIVGLGILLVKKFK
ncbi:MAG: hypothetical protein QG565_440 [Campylobacterota bacterium]|nr:hypothetical protein [Campylobacterota bacterium]MDQ1337338.1 hypothetical protein [Campylobacterota bacterium]